MEYSLLRVTDKCNQRCLFCNVPPGSSEYASSFDEVKRKIAATASSGSLILTGGEPTISKRLPEVVSLARARGIRRIELQTNATMMSSPAFARYVCGLRFDNFLISLHSHDAATSDALTGAPGFFELTLKGIGNLNRLSVHLTVNFVINSLNYRQLPAFVNFFTARKDVFRVRNTLCFSFVQPNGRAWNNRNTIIPRISEVVPYLHDALDYCLTKKVNFAISDCGIPVCFVEKFKEHHQEYQRIKRFTKYRRGPRRLSGMTDALTTMNASEKVKRTECVACAYSGECLGLWRNYARMYGLGELKPIPSPSV